MALRLGKKKDAVTEAPASAPENDWSEAALMGDADDSQMPTTTAPSPALSTSGAPDPADTFVADAFDTAPRKKPLSPVLLAGGLVLFLTAIGVAVYFAFFNAPAEDTSTPVVLPTRVSRAPQPPTAMVKTPVKIPVKTVVKVPGKTPVKPVTPGKLGIASPNTKVPAIQPVAGKPPAMVPKPNMPTPVPLMQDGLAGQPGKGTTTGTTVQVVQPSMNNGKNSPSANLPTTMQAQLKTLWKKGADAKHERNYNGARQAWQKMLKLRPGHPGVQQAIDKLPR